ncbi:MAG: hypothetical protein R6X10_09905 [Desulfobacterales bacterium]
METLTIHTGLDRFLLLDSISGIGQNSIEGTLFLSGDHRYLGIESLAQLGAMHLRFITGFSCHAFLLSIRTCSIQDKFVPNSNLLLSGKLLSRSISGFLYALDAVSEGKTLIAGEFLFATIPYDQKFKKRRLENHYRKVFSCLKNGS